MSGKKLSTVHIICVPVVLDRSSGCVQVSLSCLESWLEILGFLPQGGCSGTVSGSFHKVCCMLDGINQLSDFQKNFDSCFFCSDELLEVGRHVLRLLFLDQNQML